MDSPASSGLERLRRSKLGSPISFELQRLPCFTWRVQLVLAWSVFAVLNWNVTLVLSFKRLLSSKLQRNIVLSFCVFLVLTGECN